MKCLSELGIEAHSQPPTPWVWKIGVVGFEVHNMANMNIKPTVSKNPPLAMKSALSYTYSVITLQLHQLTYQVNPASLAIRGCIGMNYRVII